MRRVEEVAAVHHARDDHAHGRRVLLQRAHLHRRRVRAQQHALTRGRVLLSGEVERVVHVHRRMVRREVERLEVVPLALRLGPHRDREPELAEDRADLVDDRRDGVHRADPAAPRGHREIERGPATGGCRLARGERVERLLDGALQAVERDARVASILGRQRAQRALQLAQPRVLQRVELPLGVVEPHGRIERVEQRARVVREPLGLSEIVGEKHETGRGQTRRRRCAVRSHRRRALSTEPPHARRTPVTRPGQTASRGALVLLERVAHLVGDDAERLRIAHRDVGQDLPVDLEAGASRGRA